LPADRDILMTGDIHFREALPKEAEVTVTLSVYILGFS
jgi:uncharacterized lipoprotein YbaY